MTGLVVAIAAVRSGMVVDLVDVHERVKPDSRSRSKYPAHLNHIHTYSYTGGGGGAEGEGAGAGAGAGGAAAVSEAVDTKLASRFAREVLGLKTAGEGEGEAVDIDDDEWHRYLLNHLKKLPPSQFRISEGCEIIHIMQGARGLRRLSFSFHPSFLATFTRLFCILLFSFLSFRRL